LSTQDLSGLLTRGLERLGEDPAAHPVEKYLWFLAELAKWNEAYNLTAIRDPAQMVTHHLLDSLSILPWLQGDRCLDVGTGAGLPGLILALARPQTHWTLLDSKSKKIRFLQNVLFTLKPGNVELVTARVEDYHPPRPFSTIVSRAFSSLVDFYRITGHLKAIDGCLLAMKGTYPQQELAELSGPAPEVVRLDVPGLDSERHLVIFR
jgi:16S rRNA (guanine527-N7)-methyltransferase